VFEGKLDDLSQRGVIVDDQNLRHSWVV
jgi:hypothetical protein